MLLPRGYALWKPDFILWIPAQAKCSQAELDSRDPSCLLPVLCCAALGFIPSTANKEKGFLPRYNSSEQDWEEKNHCRHLKLGRVNPVLRVWCCSGANINVRNEKLWALPEECGLQWIPACSCFLCLFLCCLQGKEMLQGLPNLRAGWEQN